MDLAQSLSTFLTTYSVGRADVAYIARVSDDTWRIDHETGPGLRLTLDTAGRRLGIVAALGEVPEGRKAQVYEALLSYSGLWRATGGVRGALAGDGSAQAIVELALEDLSEGRLHRVLDNFTAKARFLAGFVAQGAPGAATEDTANFIRI